MPEITIDRIEVDGRDVRYTTSYTGDVRRFFTDEEFQLRYGVDLSNVPDAILAIPVLSQICPVAWANGATVRTPVVDEQFLKGLQRVGDALLEMHPQFMEGGRIVADEVTARQHTEGSETGLLFTGGVDSTTMYLNHRATDPHLITMQGWVFRSTQSAEWAAVQDHVESFAAERELECHFVESNLKGYLNGGMLDAHYRRHLDAPWYGGVGCGLGLLGLCAPVATVTGISDLHIASTFYEGVTDSRWGSNPDIDNEVAWSGTRCFHEDYDLNRQAKIERIAAHITETGEDLSLQTCNEQVQNCGRCRGCTRAIVGLLIAGVDPNRVGFPFDEDTLERIRDRIDDPEFPRDERRWRWENMQRAIDLDREFPAHEEEVSRFLHWLLELNLEQRLGEPEPARSTRLKYAMLRNLPYPVYSRLSELSSAVSS
jgi:hypothetical protein